MYRAGSNTSNQIWISRAHLQCF